jgi:TorA-specific chaperone
MDAILKTDAQPGASEVFDTHHSAHIADWLSGLFLAPLPTWAVERLRRPSADVLDEIGRVLECRAATRQMSEVLDAGPPRDVVRFLERRYTALFDGVAGRRTVALYESAYSGTGNRLFQEPFDDMREILRHLDFSLRDGCREPADHVSVELAALSAAITDGNAEIADELSTRLSGWIPQLLVRIDKEDPGGFYSGAATVLAVFVSSLAHRRLLTACGQAIPKE